MDGGVPVRPLPPAQMRSADRLTLAALADRLLQWVERARSRHVLCKLDERMLRDIGLDSATASHEGRKPFWQR
jgi:uncharacterized protein YjiS (DUF1127 family)